jgi:hypothetical protein
MSPRDRVNQVIGSDNYTKIVVSVLAVALSILSVVSIRWLDGYDKDREQIKNFIYKQGAINSEVDTKIEMHRVELVKLNSAVFPSRFDR